MKIFKKIIKFFKRLIFGTHLSKGESFVKAWLKFNNLKFVQQYHVKVPKDIRPSGNCYIDFMVTYKKHQYAIEYNGSQHYHYTPFFHKSYEEFIAQVNRDQYIKEWCYKNGITFIVIPYNYTTSKIETELRRYF